MTKLRAWTFAGLVMALISITSLGWCATPSYKVLYEFQGPPTDGWDPRASMILDASGNLYGTTASGGAGVGAGTVFELTPTADGWTETVLYSFQAGTDGSNPSSPLVMDKAGNLYGTTEFGGSGNSFCGTVGGCGIVFELTPPATQGGAWTESILYTFQGTTDGAFPNGVILDESGNLYGTAGSGGDFHYCVEYGCGTVFELSPVGGTWSETTLYAFSGPPDAVNPSSAVVMDASGNMYGASSAGGSGSGGYGAIYELSPSNGGWAEKVLYSLSLSIKSPSALVFDGMGDLVGTAQGGPEHWPNAVFALKAHPNGSWTEHTVFDFTDVDGGASNAAPVFDSHGNLYGTGGEGEHNGGAVWRLGANKGVITDNYFSFCAFGCPDGSLPEGGVTLDKAGNIYGTTIAGGIECVSGGCGVVYEITP
jgi:uncharacterized repeat protein (TIGR03803 family)